MLFYTNVCGNVDYLYERASIDSQLKSGLMTALQPAQDGWTCSCGAINKGKFCSQCGAKKPADAPIYKCDKCGWEPDDPTNPPKFCPECGDIFDDNDVK